MESTKKITKLKIHKKDQFHTDGDPLLEDQHIKESMVSGLNRKHPDMESYDGNILWM